MNTEENNINNSTENPQGKNENDLNSESSKEEKISETGTEDPQITEEENLKNEIDEKSKEIEDLKDKMLRVQAQAANDRKRFKEDADRSGFETKKRFLKKILDIRDNIDRALTSFDMNDEQQKSHAEGIKMIGAQFDDLFSIEGINEMKAKGEMYDLLKHEIVSRVPYNGPENRVIEVIQKGYTMNNKVLRVAKVVLSMKQSNGDETPEQDKNNGEIPIQE